MDAEASANFDMDGLAEFLQKLPAIFDSGFGTEEVTMLLRGAQELPHDAEKTWTLQVTHQGRIQPLEVHVFMDDIEAPDVYFRGSDKLIEEIQQSLDEYLDLD